MTLTEWVNSLEGESKAEFSLLCREVSTSAKVDRGRVSRDLQALIALTLPNEEKSLVGHLVGAFWQKYGKKKRTEKVEEDFDYHQLSEILPYPLGFRWRSFLWDLEKFKKGRGSSNFAFLVASLNGLATRFLSILCISEYMERAQACDADINRLLVDKLRVPADGTWKQLIDVLSSGFGDDERTPWMGQIRAAIRERHPFSKSRKGLNASTAMQDLVQFRNELLHSTKRLENEDIHEAVERLHIIYRSLAFLETGRLVSVQDEFAWVSKSKRIVRDNDISPWMKQVELREEMRAQSLVLDSDSKEITSESGDVYWMSQDEKEPAIRCWPLMHIQHWEGSVDGHDLFFFNGWDNREADYISYHSAQSLNHKDLRISWSRFQQYWRNIPVSPVPLDAKLDFLGLSDFYRSHFVGREEAINAVLSFASQPPQKYGVIRGEPGMGKTAMLAVMYHQWRNHHKQWPTDVLPLWHFCNQADGWNHPVAFLRSILAQMDELLGRNKATYSTDLHRLVQELKTYWKELSRSLTPTQRVVLVVDGLDEAVDSVSGLSPIPTLLPTLQELPKNVSVVISFRVNHSLENRRVESLLPLPLRHCFPIPHCSPLKGLSSENVKTILSNAFSGQLIPEKTFDAVWKTSTQGESGSKEEADPFILRFLAEAAEEQAIDLERPETVPHSLDELFERFWNDLPTDHDFFVHRLLGMLSVMPALGNDPLFADVFHLSYGDSLSGETITPIQVAEWRLSINKLLVFRGDKYRLFHRRFRDYVQDRFDHRDQAFALHEPLLRFCSSRHSHAKHRLYGLRYEVFHLTRLSKHKGLQFEEKERFRERLCERLWDERYIHEKMERWGRADLIAQDLSYAFESFRPEEVVWDEAGEVERTEVMIQLARSYHLANRAHQVLGFISSGQASEDVG